MEQALRTTDFDTLVRRVLASHRLKTAAFVNFVTRIGGVVANAKEETTEALVYYLESVGIAFQIMDDVSDLRGIMVKPSRLLKHRGDDIRAGKVSFPVAKAATMLPYAEFEALWKLIKSKPQDDEVVLMIIQKLENSGAIEASVDYACGLVEKAWVKVEMHLVDSMAKCMIHALVWRLVHWFHM